MDEKLMNKEASMTDEEMAKATGGYEEYWKTDREMAKHDTIDNDPLFYVGQHVCVGGDILGDGVITAIRKKGNYWEYEIDYDGPSVFTFFNDTTVRATDIDGHYDYY